MKWEKVKLGDLCNMNSGGTPRRGTVGYYGGEIPWAKISDIEDAIGGVILTTEEYITKNGLKSIGNRVFPEGTLLLAMYGSVGKTAIAGVDLSTNQAILGIRIIDSTRLSIKYLKYWLGSIKEQLLNRAVGGTLQNISLGIVKGLFIPLPPLHIQEQIADTLDKADALRRKDQELLQKYDQLAQAIFYDMFGDPVRNERGWHKKTVRDISREVKYGTSSPAEENGMYPYLRMNNITYGGELDLSSLKYINVSAKDLEKYGTQNGDLLFNRTNSKELVGKTTVVDINIPMILAGYLIRVRLNEQANPTFVSAFLNTKEGKITLRGMCKSIIGMANINAQELQDISIILPPKELQDDYQQKVKKVNDQKKHVLKTLEKSSHMFDKMSSVYFS